MYEHDFERAEKYLKNKYKAWFSADGFKQWDEGAMKAWKYLDARRRHMNYGWLRRHRGAGTEDREMKNSTPIAHCLTPNPWV